MSKPSLRPTPNARLSEADDDPQIPQEGGSRGCGWFAAKRNEEVIELITENKNAFVLLFIIAQRANWSGKRNHRGLGLGEAHLGDYEAYDMTEQEYRTAKTVLASDKWKLATFKSTSRGTIGKLSDTSFFSIFGKHPNGRSNERLTNSQRTANGQPTTNKQLKKVITEEGKTVGGGDFNPRSFVPK